MSTCHGRQEIVWRANEWNNRAIENQIQNLFASNNREYCQQRKKLIKTPLFRVTTLCPYI